MKQVARSALLPYSAEQMYDLVNDVGSYAEFLPWCESSDILEESDTQMTARLTISRAGVSQQFTTRNQLQRPVSIQLGLVDGPFTSLSARLVSRELNSNCSDISTLHPASPSWVNCQLPLKDVKGPSTRPS